MNKKLLSGFLAFLLIFALALPFGCAASAEGADDAVVLFASDDSMTVAANGWLLVNDEADLLTDEQENALFAEFSSIKENHNVNVAVATVQSLGGQTVENAAEDYVYNKSGLGKDTIVLYLAIGSRDFDIFATIGRAEDIFFTEGREYIFSQVQPLLSSGDYAGAFSTFGRICGDFIARSDAGEPYTRSSFAKQRNKSPICFVIAVAAGLLIGTIIMSKYKAQLKTVHKRNEATGYTRPGSMRVTAANEMFLYSNVSKVKRQTESSSGGSHSSHTSGGGHTSGKF
ncbi:MAG: TPM domain-containing protein [Clostridia bacterium]|nr:TPM domain-containing protein [Clostridia bacterium]